MREFRQEVPKCFGGCSFLQAFQVKRRGIFFFGTAFFLHKSPGKSQGDSFFQYFLIFIGGEAPVDPGMLAAFVKRCILAEQAEEKTVFGKIFL